MSHGDHTIYHDLPIKAPVEKVYAAVTDPTHLMNWWPEYCTGNPVMGETYNFRFGPEYDWYAEVTEAQAPHHFHVKMTKSDPDWDPTSFGFDLEATDQGTQLKFSHRGWPECNAHFRHSSYCWAILLKALKDYVEKGKVIPFAERE